MKPITCTKTLIKGWTPKGYDKGLSPKLLMAVSNEFAKDKTDMQILEKLLELYPHRFRDKRIDSVKVCGGSLTAKVELDCEPYYGGVNHSISVEFKCDECHTNYYHNGLPYDEESLSEFLTKIVKGVKDD